MKGKILVVDDEQNILDLVVYNLEAAGFKAITALTGTEAMEKIRDEQPDLIILDVMLPEMDGFEVLAALRRETKSPVIMLTAKKEEIDKVLGLEMGADDYLTKPFSPRELTARIKAILRRSNEKDTQIEEKSIIKGDLRIDTVKHQVFLQGREIDLTAKEFDLLKLFAANPGRVYTRENLLQSLWDYDYFGDTKTIDVHIRHLRKKIEADPANPKLIKTIRGVGYKFQE
ncbi:MAG: response regulator transcription factor [Bacillota bacterium]